MDLAPLVWAIAVIRLRCRESVAQRSSTMCQRKGLRFQPKNNAFDVISLLTIFVVDLRTLVDSWQNSSLYLFVVRLDCDEIQVSARAIISCIEETGLKLQQTGRPAFLFPPALPGLCPPLQTRRSRSGDVAHECHVAPGRRRPPSHLNSRQIHASSLAPSTSWKVQRRGWLFHLLIGNWLSTCRQPDSITSPCRSQAHCAQ